MATVRVESKATLEIDGFAADVYGLETDFRGLRSKSWVTATGELLRQEFEGHTSIQITVPGQVDLCHAARAQPVENLIMT